VGSQRDTQERKEDQHEWDRPGITADVANATTNDKGDEDRTARSDTTKKVRSSYQLGEQEVELEVEPSIDSV
jgi:hypothetical protein